MLALGMVFIFAGYTVSGYGWVLLRGYNIPFRNWVSPLNPYTGSFTPGSIPANIVFPPGPGGIEAGGGPVPGASAPPAGVPAGTPPSPGGAQLA